MRFFLMQKEEPVALLDVNQNTGFVRSILREENPERFPVLVRFSEDHMEGMNQWIRTRSIPKTRENLARILQDSGTDVPEALSFRNLGLNLSDQYWFKPEGSSLHWREVNFFQNSFEEFKPGDGTGLSFSPDASSNGDLPKEWRILDGKRVLFKASSAPFFQQAWNEAAASRMLDLMKIPHVSYEVRNRNSIGYSVCETFVTTETEYVPALYIRNACQKRNDENSYMHFLRCMDQLGIPTDRKEIDRMLSFDFLINNSDRHFGNFGFIRNADTLEWKGMAPLFDHGNSLWYNAMDRDIVLREQEAKPFREEQNRQIELVKNFSASVCGIHKDSLQEVIHTVFSENSRMTEERIEKIADRVLARRDDLKRRRSRKLNLVRMRNSGLER